MPYAVAAFYRFVALPDAEAIRPRLDALCTAHRIAGTILLAAEGINGTVAGAPADTAAFLDALRDGPLFGGRLAAVDVKLSRAGSAPFGRLKIHLKREILTFDGGATDPVAASAEPVATEAWNTLLDTPGLLVLDTRNAFEVALGSFEGAVDPRLRRFSDFRSYADGLDPLVHPAVAMYCTGGIRCEKAGAYLRARGFARVHTLAGGILRYLETIPEGQSRWRGDCFVFDRRIALGTGLVERPDHDPETLR